MQHGSRVRIECINVFRKFEPNPPDRVNAVLSGQIPQLAPQIADVDLERALGAVGSVNADSVEQLRFCYDLLRVLH